MPRILSIVRASFNLYCSAICKSRLMPISILSARSLNAAGFVALKTAGENSLVCSRNMKRYPSPTSMAFNKIVVSLSPQSGERSISTT